MYPKKRVQVSSQCAKMFTDLVIKDKLSKQPKGPLIAEWINEVG